MELPITLPRPAPSHCSPGPAEQGTYSASRPSPGILSRWLRGEAVPSQLQWVAMWGKAVSTHTLTLRVPSGRQRQVHNEQLSLKILARRVGGVRDAVRPSPAHDHCGKPKAPTPRKLQTDFFFKENEFYFYNQNILIKIF